MFGYISGVLLCMRRFYLNEILNCLLCFAVGALGKRRGRGGCVFRSGGSRLVEFLPTGVV